MLLCWVRNRLMKLHRLKLTDSYFTQAEENWVSEAEMVLQRISFPARGTARLRFTLQSSHLTATTEALISHLLLLCKWPSGEHFPSFMIHGSQSPLKNSQEDKHLLFCRGNGRKNWLLLLTRKSGSIALFHICKGFFLINSLS